MPDVKWYAGGATGIAISTTAVTGGTDARLLRQTGGVVGNSLLSDDATNVTLSSGQFRLPDGSVTSPALSFTDATNWGLWRDSNGLHVSFLGAEGIGIDSTSVYFKSTGTLLWSSGTTNPFTSLDLGLARHAASSLRFTAAGAGAASVVIGTSSQPSTPASAYLFIEGVSGAGGTPTTAHLTAGNGVALYTQAAHDAAATKFVMAYNLGGSMRYLVFTLDGSTTTFTNSATRP